MTVARETLQLHAIHTQFMPTSRTAVNSYTEVF